MTAQNFLSDRTHEVEWSGIRIMFALADEIPDIVNLGIGQPDFDTPEFIRDAAKQALDEGYTRYPPAKGFADLRYVIAEKLKAENGIVADPDTEIYVAVGAMQVIFNTCLHMLNPGDEVIVFDPGYDYYSQIRLFGGVPVPVATHESNLFKVDPADIQAAISAPQDCVQEMVATYDKRRHLVHEGLNAIAGIQCLIPESTFYAFPNISSTGLSSWEFAKYLAKEHKRVCPPLLCRKHGTVEGGACAHRARRRGPETRSDRKGFRPTRIEWR
jgi:aspartate/methionine/tyrosine aminotransferase